MAYVKTSDVLGILSSFALCFSKFTKQNYYFFLIKIHFPTSLNILSLKNISFYLASNFLQNSNTIPNKR
jgi:hypothetical protein